jgi:hypothetical protein
MSGNRRAAMEATGVAAFFAAATLCLFAPALRDFGERVFATPGALQADNFLITWILSWNCHALATAPLQLFDANIFHPARATLAGSEHMLGHLPLFAPAYVLTENPVAAIQFTRLASVALCGLSMYALLRHWGTGVAAALVGGFVYAFCPARYFTIHALQLVAMQYLPLAFVFLDRVTEHGRRRDAAGLAVCLGLQMMCSFYLAYITAVAIAVVAPLALRRRGRAVVYRGPAIVALAIAFVVVAASALPYALQASRGELPQHSTALLHSFSATPWASYATRPVVARFGPVGQAYVGVLPALLCLSALLALWRLPSLRHAIASSAAVGAVMYVFALGPYLDAGDWRIPLPYTLAATVVPGFAAMRVPLRFTFGVMFAVGALTGLGLEALLRRTDRRWAAAAALGALLLIGFDYRLGQYQPQMNPLPGPGRIPPVYQRLASLPDGPVLEIPVAIQGEDDFASLDREARYAYLSAFHWKPLLNGYTGYPPASAAVVKRIARTLPDGDAVSLLRRATGLRYVVVHGGTSPDFDRERWRQPAGLVRLGRFGDDELFEVADARPADLVEDLLGGPRAGHTLLDNPVVPLTIGERRAGIATVEGARSPARLIAGLPLRLPLAITNRGSATWPVLTDDDQSAVVLEYRWLRGGELVAQGVLRLPFDLAAGARVQTEVFVPTPSGDGAFALQLGIAQGRQWFAEPFQLVPLIAGAVPGV